MYDLLETNIPKSIMAYSDTPFLEDAPLFPPHQVVKDYLIEYAEDVEPLVRFGRRMVDVAPGTDGAEHRTVWKVTHQSVLDDSESSKTTDIFDAVIVANGHYSDCYIPSIPGLEAWSAVHPNAVIHAKGYRRPPTPEDGVKKILIIGAGISGVDIATQIASETEGVEVLLSSRASNPVQNTDGSWTFADPQAPPLHARGVRVIPEVSDFLPDSEEGQTGVRLKNGTVETDIDLVIFATGYFYSYPFLRGLEPPVTTTGERTEGLWQHVFWHTNPTLSFLGVPSRIVPFVVAESQSAVVARYLSGRLSLPSIEDREAWEEKRIEERGPGRKFHIMGYPEDAAYVNELAGMCEAADEQSEKDGTENGKGKKPPRWGERECWIRANIPGMQKVVKSKPAEERKKIKRMDDIGFVFERRQTGGVGDEKVGEGRDVDAWES